MDQEANERNQALIRAIRTCKVISKLCMTAFLIIILWIVFAFCVMMISLVNAPLSEGVIQSALPMVILYTLYGINYSLIPLTVGKMFKDIWMHRKPFQQSACTQLRYLSGILIVYTILEFIAGVVSSQLIIPVHDVEVAIGNFVGDFAYNAGTTVDIFPLIIAGVFFALSYVFKYGVSLQRDSDETL